MKLLKEFTQEYKPLVIVRPVLNPIDVRSWMIQRGLGSALRDMVVPIAWGRNPVDWGLIKPDISSMNIVDTRRREVIHNSEEMVLTFYDFGLDMRYQQIVQAMGINMEKPINFPYVLLSLKNQMPDRNHIGIYKGVIQLGPEEFRPYDIYQWKLKLRVTEY